MIENLPVNAAAFRLQAVILYDGPQAKSRSVALHNWPNVAFPMPEMQRVGLGQPHVPVDAGTFVKPAVPETRVHAHDQEILRAIFQKLSDIKAKRRIAVVVSSDEVAIEKNQGAAKRAVKLDRNAADGIFFRNIEGPAIPSHARFRIPSAQRLVAVSLQFIVADKWQFNRPVMRQIQRAPLRVVKLLCRERKLSRLGEISLTRTEAEIAPRIAAVSLKKLPAKVDKQVLRRGDR